MAHALGHRRDQAITGRARRRASATIRAGTRSQRVRASRLCVGLLAVCVTVVETGAQDGAPLVQLTHDGHDKQRPMWSRDGKWLAFGRHESGGTHIWQYVVDPASPSQARRLTDRKAPEYNGAFSPRNDQLLVSFINLSGTQGNLDIVHVGLDGKDPKTVAGDVDGKLSHQDWPSWSPDGKRFAFNSSHEGNEEIYVANLDGSEVVRLTQSAGRDCHPCWSPDGSKVAFATDRWGGLELATVRPDGTGLVRVTSSHGLDDYPAISPDGQRLAFVSNRDGQFEIYVAGVDGREPVNVSRHPLRDTYPTWTPDGRGITFVSNRDGAGEIYTIPMIP